MFSQWNGKAVFLWKRPISRNKRPPPEPEWRYFVLFFMGDIFDRVYSILWLPLLLTRQGRNTIHVSFFLGLYEGLSSSRIYHWLDDFFIVMCYYGLRKSIATRICRALLSKILHLKMEQEIMKCWTIFATTHFCLHVYLNIIY